MLADTIVKRWQDHTPLHRLEGIYARDGLELARSTVRGLHAALGELVTPLVSAMRADAFTQPYFCVDATGVLVQQKERCRTGHFWVMVAPGRHVLFEFTRDHSSDAVDDLLAGYHGYLVAAEEARTTGIGVQRDVAHAARLVRQRRDDQRGDQRGGVLARGGAFRGSRPSFRFRTQRFAWQCRNRPRGQ